MSDQLERYKSLQATRKRSRPIRYNPEFVPKGQPYEKYRWVENISSGLRFKGKAHEIKVDGYSRPIINHTGWFLDEFQDETCWGVVVQLPAGKDRKARFVPGYQLSHDGEDSAVLDFHSMTEDLARAVRNADSMAQTLSEQEREYHRIERIRSEIYDLTQRRVTLRDRVRRRIRQWRAFRKAVAAATVEGLFGPRPLEIPSIVVEVYEQGIRNLRTQMHNDWREIKRLEKDL